MAVDFAKTAAFIIIFGFLWNYARGTLPDGTLRRAMSTIYN